MNQQVSADQKALVERILASESFHKSGRSRQLLQYLSEHHFGGRPDAIHETRIGAELFERGRDFDPSADSIVRASMRQLRQRLAEFYESTGATEHWELSIPRGEYRLHFEMRSTAALSHAPAVLDAGHAPSGESDEPTAAEPAEAHPLRRANRYAWVPSFWSGAFVTAALVGAFFLGSLWRAPGVQSSSSLPPVADRQDSILEHLLESTSGPVHFVPSDSVINLVQSFTRTPISFEEYRSRAVFAPDHPAARRDPGHWNSLITRELLNIGDATIVLRAAREYPQHASRMILRQSRDLRARDLRTGNFVFLGSINANPWVSVFDAGNHFQFERAMPELDAGWRNTSPRAGELLRYPPAQRSDRGSVSYAHVAMTANVSHSGRVLLVGGCGQPDTEAAGEYVLAEASARSLAEALGVASLDAVPGFEVILRTERSGNTWRVAEVVAHRIHRTQISYSGLPADPAVVSR